MERAAFLGDAVWTAARHQSIENAPLVVFATVGAYVVHVKILNAEMEKKILSGNAGSVYIQSVRSKIIHLGRVMVGLAVAILFLAALLDSGGI